jgi:hypothetical protein
MRRGAQAGQPGRRHAGLAAAGNERRCIMKANQILSIVALTLLTACGASRAQSYAIVDTNQTTFYSNTSSIAAPSSGQAFYGQDAQFTGNAPSYTTSGDGLVVTDNVTGLEWTQSADWSGDGNVNVSDKFTYAQAQAYVSTLNAQNYGGYNDWRMPSTKELYSLIDFTGTDPDPMASGSAGLTPFIDSSVFEFGYGDTAAGERVIDSQWVVSTIYVGTVMGGQEAMFGVNFADGRIKGYPTTGGPGGAMDYYARFVRGNESYGDNALTDNGNGTITDSATELMWSQDDNATGVNWEDALAWVEQKNAENYLGHDDWRLPDVKELQSIVDYTRSPDTTGSAAIDEVFDATTLTNLDGQEDYGFYWSGTTHVSANGAVDRAAYVCFGRGMGQMMGDIMDVHGAGCQRSDPKDGDESSYPLAGQGPQGDVQRVFNFVRLVRDAESVVGDFDGDGDVDADDVVQLCANIGGDPATYDLDGDGDVDEEDMTFHVETYLEYDSDGDGVADGAGTVRGDFNRDGTADGTDLSIMAAHYAGPAGFAGGNANCDSIVNGTDLSILASTFGAVATAAVPEPATLIVMAGGSLTCLLRRRR